MKMVFTTHEPFWWWGGKWSEVKSLSCVWLFATLWTATHCPWDSPGKNTGVGCHFLLQRIFLTQGSNPGVPHCKQDTLPSEPPGKSKKATDNLMRVALWWDFFSLATLKNSFFDFRPFYDNMPHRIAFGVKIFRETLWASWTQISKSLPRLG